MSYLNWFWINSEATDDLNKLVSTSTYEHFELSQFGQNIFVGNNCLLTTNFKLSPDNLPRDGPMRLSEAPTL